MLNCGRKGMDMVSSNAQTLAIKSWQMDQLHNSGGGINILSEFLFAFIHSATDSTHILSRTSFYLQCLKFLLLLCALPVAAWVLLQRPQTITDSVFTVQLQSSSSPTKGASGKEGIEYIISVFASHCDHGFPICSLGSLLSSVLLKILNHNDLIIWSMFDLKKLPSFAFVTEIRKNIL